jgi:hypothetical protein
MDRSMGQDLGLSNHTPGTSPTLLTFMQSWEPGPIQVKKPCMGGKSLGNSLSILGVWWGYQEQS